MALYSGTVGTTPIQIIPAGVRRGIEITIKSGGPVSIHCGPDAPNITRETGNDVFQHQNVCINNSVDASTAIWAVADVDGTEWSAREFL